MKLTELSPKGTDPEVHPVKSYLADATSFLVIVPS